MRGLVAHGDPPKHRVGTRWKLCGLFLLQMAIWLTACDANGPVQLGELFDVSTAVPLSEVLSDGSVHGSGSVVLSGKIGEVCRSSGCWFVLRDVADGKVHEILADLKGGASFTVSASFLGRRAFVSGTLVGSHPDRKLRVTGLVLE